MNDLAAWFEGIETAAPVPPSGAVETSPAWLIMPQPEITGIAVDASGALPLLCQGCDNRKQGICRLLARPPEQDDASLCRGFIARQGVMVGRCWLHRVDLINERLVWLMALPPVSQQQAQAWAVEHYGRLVQGVFAVPGAVSLPLK